MTRLYNTLLGAGMSHVEFRRMWEQMGPLEQDAVLAALTYGLI